jgi:hypothetical protein
MSRVTRGVERVLPQKGGERDVYVPEPGLKGAGRQPNEMMQS